MIDCVLTAGCTSLALRSPVSPSGSFGKRNSAGSKANPAHSSRGRRITTNATPTLIAANTNDGPYTPANGAKRATTSMLAAALPSCSQVKPRCWCVPSMATHSAATAGSAQGLRMAGPASTANTPKCKPLATKNPTKMAAAAGALRTILSSSVRRTFDAARFRTAGGVAKSYPRSCFVVNPIE
jgi:hypothetical protein